MKISNQMKVSIENFDKCHVVCDSDSSLGQLYDFSCVFQAFILKKIKDVEEAKKASEEKVQPMESAN